MAWFSHWWRRSGSVSLPNAHQRPVRALPEIPLLAEAIEPRRLFDAAAAFLLGDLLITGDAGGQLDDDVQLSVFLDSGGQQRVQILDQGQIVPIDLGGGVTVNSLLVNQLAGGAIRIDLGAGDDRLQLDLPDAGTLPGGLRIIVEDGGGDDVVLLTDSQTSPLIRQTELQISADTIRFADSFLPTLQQVSFELTGQLELNDTLYLQTGGGDFRLTGDVVTNTATALTIDVGSGELLISGAIGNPAAELDQVSLLADPAGSIAIGPLNSSSLAELTGGRIELHGDLSSQFLFLTGDVFIQQNLTLTATDLLDGSAANFFPGSSGVSLTVADSALVVLGPVGTTDPGSGPVALTDLSLIDSADITLTAIELAGRLWIDNPAGVTDLLGPVRIGSAELQVDSLTIWNNLTVTAGSLNITASQPVLLGLTGNGPAHIETNGFDFRLTSAVLAGTPLALEFGSTISSSLPGGVFQLRPLDSLTSITIGTNGPGLRVTPELLAATTGFDALLLGDPLQQGAIEVEVPVTAGTGLHLQTPGGSIAIRAPLAVAGQLTLESGTGTLLAADVTAQEDLVALDQVQIGIDTPAGGDGLIRIESTHGSIRLISAIEGENTAVNRLQLVSANGTELQGAVGDIRPLAALQVSGRAILHADITTAGPQRYDGDVLLAASVALASNAAGSNGADLLFGQQVHGAAPGGTPPDLTITTGTSGAVQFAGPVGDGGPLGAVLVTANSDLVIAQGFQAASLVQLAGTGDASLSGDVTLTGPAGLSLSARSIEVHGPVDTSIGSGGITLVSTESIEISQLLTTATGAIELTAGTAITLAALAGLQSQSGQILLSATGNITLGAIETGRAAADAIRIESTLGSIHGNLGTPLHLRATGAGAVTTLRAATGIGDPTPLLLEVTQLAALTDTGNLQLEADGTLHILQARALTGNVTLQVNGSVTAATDSLEAGRDLPAELTISAHGDLDVSPFVSAMVLTPGDVVWLSAGQVLTLPAAGLNVAEGRLELVGGTDILTPLGRELGPLVAQELRVQSGSQGGTTTLITTVDQLSVDLSNAPTGTALVVQETDGLQVDRIVTADGSIRIDAATHRPGDLFIQHISAGLGEVLLSTVGQGGAILDGSPAELAVVAHRLTLVASSGIGTGSPLDVQLAELEALNTTSGEIRLTAVGDVALLRAEQQGAGGIELTATGELRVVSPDIGPGVRALTGSVLLTGQSVLVEGLVISEQGILELEAAGSLNVTATGSIRALQNNIALQAGGDVSLGGDITADVGTVRVQASGDIRLPAPGAITAGEVVTLSTSGAVLMEDGASLTSTHADVWITAARDVLLGQVSAARQITIESQQGAVRDAGDSGGADLTAPHILLQAARGIGEGNALELATQRLAVRNSGAGDIELNNDSGAGQPLEIGTLVDPLGVTLRGVSNFSPEGGIRIENLGPIQVLEAITQLGRGTLALLASGAESDLLITATVHAPLRGGLVELHAERDLQLRDTGTLEDIRGQEVLGTAGRLVDFNETSGVLVRSATGSVVSPVPRLENLQTPMVSNLGIARITVDFGIEGASNFFFFVLWDPAFVDRFDAAPPSFDDVPIFGLNRSRVTTNADLLQLPPDFAAALQVLLDREAELGPFVQFDGYDPGAVARIGTAPFAGPETFIAAHFYGANPNKDEPYNPAAPIPITVHIWDDGNITFLQAGRDLGQATLSGTAEVPGEGLQGGVFVFDLSIEVPPLEAPRVVVTEIASLSPPETVLTSSAEEAPLVLETELEREELILIIERVQPDGSVARGPDGTLLRRELTGPAVTEQLSDLPELFRRLRDGRWRIYLQQGSSSQPQLIRDVELRQGLLAGDDAGTQDRPPTGN